MGKSFFSAIISEYSEAINYVRGVASGGIITCAEEMMRWPSLLPWEIPVLSRMGAHLQIT